MKQRTSIFALCIIFFALSFRLWVFADHLAVNVAYHDMWDFYRPIFNGGGFWDAFMQQHGPHREGIGLVIMKALIPVSHMNTKWDAFACVIAVVTAAALGIYVAVKSGIPFGMRLLAIPLLSLTVRQYEVFAGPTNLSHGAMPQLLVIAFCALQSISTHQIRLALQAVVVFLGIFTGFALFIGLVAPVVFLAGSLNAYRKSEKSEMWWSLGAVVAVATGWIIFAHGYQFMPAVPNFRFPYEKPLEYLWFIALMLSNFLGLSGDSAFHLGVGVTIFGVLVFLGVTRGLQLLKPEGIKNTKNVVVFILAAYSLAFLANTAVGRVMLGRDVAGSSRYVPLIMPAFFAIFLECAALFKARNQLLICILAALAVAPACIVQRAGDRDTANFLSEGRKRWMDAYLRTHDEAKAVAESGFQIYPAPVTERLKFLEDHRLNLFANSKKE